MNFPCGMNLTAFRFPTRRTETVSLGNWCIKALADINTLPDEPLSTIHVLIAYLLNKPSHFGISHPEYELTPSELDLLNSQLGQLVAGKPLPYITGKQEFYGLDLKISSDVLIPRPETELLVEHAISWLNLRQGHNQAADVGIGSGCIAISISKNNPEVSFIGTDISLKSLLIAKENLKTFKLNNQIRLIQTNLLSGIDCKFDLICANLPYIPTETLKELAVSIQEPLTALDGGKDGLDYINKLISQCKSKIRENGLILLEIDSLQYQPVIKLAQETFPYAKIVLINDLAGLPRLVTINIKGI